MNQTLYNHIRGMLPSSFKRHIVTLWRRLRALARLVHFWMERSLGKGYPKHIDRIFTHLTVYEKQALYRLAKSLPPGSQAVEIGSYLGASACCLAAGMVGSNSTLHCVDTFMCDGMPGERHDVYPEFVENTKLYTDLIAIHRGSSKDVVGGFDQPVALLFIDGDHSWEGVTTDLKLYVPLMKDQAVLIMHDVNASTACRRALDEIVLPAEIQCLVRLPNLYAGRIRPSDAKFSRERQDSL